MPGVDWGMESYKRGSHTVWDCKYHLVWVTKHRYAVLGGDVGQRCRELLRETARAPRPASRSCAIRLAKRVLLPDDSYRTRILANVHDPVLLASGAMNGRATSRAFARKQLLPS